MGCRRPLAYQAYQAVNNLILRDARTDPLLRARLWPGLAGVPALDCAQCLARDSRRATGDASLSHQPLRPPARDVAATRRLMELFLESVSRSGHMRVCGQMVSFVERRTDALFERYGFQVLHRSEISKYRNVYPGQQVLTFARS